MTISTSTQYAVINPALGQYNRVNTIEEVTPLMDSIAKEFYLLQTYNTPVSKIETTVVETESGTSSTEVWTVVELPII